MNIHNERLKSKVQLIAETMAVVVAVIYGESPLSWQLYLVVYCSAVSERVCGGVGRICSSLMSDKLSQLSPCYYVIVYQCWTLDWTSPAGWWRHYARW